MAGPPTRIEAQQIRRTRVTRIVDPPLGRTLISDADLQKRRSRHTDYIKFNQPEQVLQLGAALVYRRQSILPRATSEGGRTWSASPVGKRLSKSTSVASRSISSGSKRSRRSARPS